MKKTQILVIGIILLLGGTGFLINSKMNAPNVTSESSTVTQIADFKNGEDVFISASELKQKIGSDNLVILDGNHPKNYAKGHISGAINIGFKGLSRSTGKPGDALWGTILPQDDLTAKLESFGITNDSLIVAYSDTFKGPGAGGRAVWQLRMAGLKNVKLLYGGLEMWRQAGFELTKDVHEPKKSNGLTLKEYDENYRAELHYIEANLSKIKLVDVRSKKEFTGDDTSRGESRGGHITGAHWIEWTALLNPDSTPKAPEQIVAIMAGYGITPEDDFTVY